MEHRAKVGLLTLILLALFLLIAAPAHAQDFFDFKNFALPDIKLEPAKGSNVPPNLQVSFFIISLSLIPYTIVSCTSFIRTTIMLSYLKSALGSCAERLVRSLNRG